MGSNNFIMSFVQSCASGKLTLSECGPVWQFSIIALLLAVAVLFLAFLVMAPQGQSAQN